MSEQLNPHPKRRHGPDFLVKYITCMKYLSWFFLLVIITLISKASPRMEGFFDRLLNVHLRSTWDTDLARIAFYLMFLLFILCIFGIIANAKRNRRNYDKLSFSIIFSTFLSVLGMILYLIFF